MLSTPQLSTNIANPKRLYTKPLHEPRALQVNKDISNSQLLQSRSLPGAYKAEGFAVVGVEFPFSLRVWGRGLEVARAFGHQKLTSEGRDSLNIHTLS